MDVHGRTEMSAPNWLRSFWAKRPRFHSRVGAPAAKEKQEEKAMMPALIDEKWLAGSSLIDTIGGPYNAKGMHEVMDAVDKQPFGLWKIFVARLIATARRYSKDLHEQSVYVQDLHAEMEKARKISEDTIKILTKARSEDEISARANAKKAKEQIDRLLEEKVDLMAKLETAQKSEASMVEQVKAANLFRESMKAFAEREKTIVGA
jgi:hypothetical protein